MAKQPASAITPTRADDYPEWYQQVIKAADLAENSDVRGCMIIKPWGYAIWEHMQQALDKMFKATGHQNAYFPLFIPKRFLEKEAQHVEGFAKECAVVTHSRLELNDEGKLIPAGKLDEELIVRPTSETIIGAAFSRWVQSYRDLPIKLNQWANVVRWEMRTRMFLRTAEFLWQEGHTVHATEEEAQEETRQMLEVYADFAENFMAMPVVKGEKTADERFPGAVATYSIEAMMQDRKALQAGTSHFLGQNFAKAQEIKFQDQNGAEVFAWTTSWGVSTRLVGALLMTHSDDDGLVLPPRLAPQQIVLLPIYRTDEEKSQVLEFCAKVKSELEALVYGGLPLRVEVDDRDLRGGEKNWQQIKRGVPLRAEIGPRDVASDSVFLARRDRGHGKGDKQSLSRADFVGTAVAMLTEMQDGLLAKARQLREDNTRTVTTLDEFRQFFTPENANKPEIHGGFAVCHFSEGDEVQAILKDLKVTPRCIPFDLEQTPGQCVFTGQPTSRRAIFGKSY
ncbi:proline--tRNA ligase [Lignipirellula cremea]|uniref:Proline--tRNA ligase n=1 Tax=Lignipirellula cremea TaxID=2528010 RepID=A0A518DW59_9BACT|nr:proline--tRNA ligase [Lignipirellula cremea]QDU96063.1 Proline--tRNA ligase [Lignipirellula cremea]